MSMYRKRNFKWLTTPRPKDGKRLTWDELVRWMADTGYIEGFVYTNISPLDREFTDDFIQECWVQILSVPHDKLLDIYYKGKGKFTNYIKSIMKNNIHSCCSNTYKNIKKPREGEVYLDDLGWTMLENGNPAPAVEFGVSKNPDGDREHRVQFDIYPITVTADEEYTTEQHDIKEE